MGDAEGDVAAMARQITRVVSREGWQRDRSVVPEMQKLLGRLTSLRVDVDLLQRTKIGAMVSKLKKHEDELVRGYSATLTKRWKEQVGVAAGGDRRDDRRPAPSPSPPKQAADPARLESARRRLKESYATEKASRESRTVQMINRPIGKSKRGVTLSAGPSRSSITRISTARPRSTTLSTSAPQRGASAPASASRRVLPPPRKDSLPRRLPPAPSRPKGRPLTRDELHEERIRKLKALSDRAGGTVSASSDRSQSSKADSHARPGRDDRPSSRDARPSRDDRPSSARSTTSSKDLPSAEEERRAMLAKMFPRVCGVAGSSASTGSSKSGSAKGGAASSSSGGRSTKRSKPVSYTENQREVLAWLRGLSVDMSEYAPAFFENGFDSMKLLTAIEKEDLPGLVPKKGHHRLIQQALDDLRRKHSTAASSRSRPVPRKQDRQAARRRHDPFDEDSDDSFVVDDSDDFSPGVITAMFRRGRKRSYSIDSADSRDMEASFDEIQHEEARSRAYGELEDYEEELRNKKMNKKKKKA